MSQSLLALALLVATISAAPTSLDEVTLANSFNEYVVAFNKTYVEEEIGRRFEAFKINLQQINTDNELEGSEVYGLTKFSDIHPDEFRARFLTFKRDPANDRNNVPVFESTETNATKSIDWRKQKKVTPVKDQGQCGSCWAFSTTEAVESAWLMSGKPQQILSTQEVVACDKKDLGCNGGDTVSAYKFLQKNGGMATAKAYPDTSSKRGKTGKCIKADEKKKVVAVTGFSYATPPKPDMDEDKKWKANEVKMAASMTTAGPLSICVDAEKWQNYKKGIITKTCKQQLDHCVQAVGYDQTGPKPYWIVRNSWNTDWGIDGYIHVGMGHNYCGIANEATIVAVKPA